MLRRRLSERFRVAIAFSVTLLFMMNLLLLKLSKSSRPVWMLSTRTSIHLPEASRSHHLDLRDQQFLSVTDSGTLFLLTLGSSFRALSFSRFGLGGAYVDYIVKGVHKLQFKGTLMMVAMGQVSQGG